MAKAPAAAAPKKLSLLAALDEVVEDTGIATGVDMPPIPTGINVLDYANGKMVKGIPQVGINPGHVVVVIGGTGVGKSTLVEQMAAAFVENYEHGLVYKFDFERAATIKRFQNVCRWSEAQTDAKYRLLRKGLSSERVREAVMKMSRTKLAMEADLTVPDVFYPGTTTLTPTAVIIDSVMAMVSNRVAGVAKPKGDADEAGAAETAKALDKAADTSNMEGAQDAKANNQTARAIVGPAYDANMTIFSVNHIRKKVDTGMFKEKAEVFGMKQNETMPGGTGFPQFADFLLRLDPGARLSPDELFGIRGYIVTCTIIKSRNAPAGKSFELVFDQENGFDNDLSNLQFLRANKMLKGGGAGTYIEGLDQFKFSLKSFKTKYNTDAAFNAAVNELLEGELIASISREFVPVDLESLPDVSDAPVPGEGQAVEGEEEAA